MGTSVGTQVFVKYGWRPGAALSLAWSGWQLFILLLRGPHCERFTWLGYQGGLEPRKWVMDERKKQKAAHASEQENNRSYPEKGDERDGTRNAGEGGASPLGEVDEKGSGRDIEASPRDSEIEKEKIP